MKLPKVFQHFIDSPLDQHIVHQMLDPTFHRGQFHYLPTHSFRRITLLSTHKPNRTSVEKTYSIESILESNLLSLIEV